MASFGLTINCLIILSKLLLLLGVADAFNLTSTGSTIELNGIPYYIPGRHFISLPYFNSRTTAGLKGLLGGLVPVTVLRTATVNLDVKDLAKTVEGFGEQDDVWGEGFLSGK